MPARAPKPGVGRRIAISEEMASAEDDWLRVVCERDGRDVTLLASSIGPSDETACLHQAGVDLWSAMSNPTSITNIAAVYWMARRKNGERELTFKKVAKTLPNIAALVDAGIEMYLPDPEGDDGDEEAEAVDPTGSGLSSEKPGPA